MGTQLCVSRSPQGANWGSGSFCWSAPFSVLSPAGYLAGKRVAHSGYDHRAGPTAKLAYLAVHRCADRGRPLNRSPFSASVYFAIATGPGAVIASESTALTAATRFLSNPIALHHPQQLHLSWVGSPEWVCTV